MGFTEFLKHRTWVTPNKSTDQLSCTLYGSPLMDRIYFPFKAIRGFRLNPVLSCFTSDSAGSKISCFEHDGSGLPINT